MVLGIRADQTFDRLAMWWFDALEQAAIAGMALALVGAVRLWWLSRPWGILVVMAFANIHAGEVDGKEAALMLARDIATGDDKSLLKELVVLIVPILNADGNEKIDKANRTSQNGPEEGVGIRANAAGYDLNRDFVKLETPEIRALAKVITRWDPAVIVDLHTTNGSYHRYTLTYDGPRHPAAEADVIAPLKQWLQHRRRHGGIDRLPHVPQQLQRRPDA